MCGIVGIYGFDRGLRVAPERLVAQNDALAHRGPDDGAVYVGPGIGLGHRRLAIIDLGGGHQPMWDAEGRIGIVFNGEIYNYRELRTELEARGHRFQSDSDTETIVHGYREWGEDVVLHLRGMFAFAIYDRTLHTLLLARDRLGKKPLYVYADERRLIFASELKAILADPAVPRALDPDATLDYFAYGYVPGPRSILRGIEKLPPGHVLVARGERRAIRPYWQLDFSSPEEETPLSRWVDQLDETLSEAVRLRLRSDVPLGAFLSGGIDSSLVVALMAKQATTPVKTHTIGFGEAAYDERGPAAETARRFHTDHFERVVSVDAAAILDRLAWHYDEPFGDSSAVPTYYLSAATRERVTVALSGDGGDESFAGYRRYQFAMIEHEVRRRLPAPVRRALVRPLARMYPKADYLPQFLRAKATLTNLAESHERAYFLSLTQKTAPRFLSPDFYQNARRHDPYEAYGRSFARTEGQHPLSRLQHADFQNYLVDDILVKVDRASMAHALEVRVPILDHRFVELAARMPARFKLDGRTGKVALKALARRYLPPETFDRKKMGFSIPLAEWLRGGLQGRAQEVLFDRPSGRSGVLSTAGVRRMWYEHQLGLADHGTSLWWMLMFEEWAARFLAPTTIEAPRRVERPSTVEGPSRRDPAEARARA